MSVVVQWPIIPASRPCDVEEVEAQPISKPQPSDWRFHAANILGAMIVAGLYLVAILIARGMFQ